MGSGGRKKVKNSCFGLLKYQYLDEKISALFRQAKNIFIKKWGYKTPLLLENKRSFFKKDSGF
jgi:hypothetical protein